jgi:DNA-binding transcriptional LysR family regulator
LIAVELRQLRSVEAVARHRNFTRAAEELHIAQSALSHHVQRLERELDTSLFERTSRRVTPTEAGLVIAARARRVLAELDAARAEIDELRGVLRGRVRVGAVMPVGDLDVPGLLARFSVAHSGVEVSLREGMAIDMFRWVSSDELDAAFCLLAGEPPAELAVERLTEEEVVAAFAPGRAPAGPYVSVADLAPHPLVATRRGSSITTVVERMFADAGLPLRLALESGDLFLMRSLAAQGFATAILPRSLTEIDGPPIDVRGLEPTARLPAALIWRRGRDTPPAARAFIDFVRHEAGGAAHLSFVTK